VSADGVDSIRPWTSRDAGRAAACCGVQFGHSAPGCHMRDFFKMVVRRGRDSIPASREVLFAVAEIMFEMIAVVFEDVEALVLDFPTRPGAGVAYPWV
jgi:hypothetical protein